MAKCRKCGLEIRFVKSRRGKWIPHNANDNEPHYGVCKAVALGESPKADYFIQYGPMGVAPEFHPISGRRYYDAVGKKTGKKAPPPCCPEVPPWELCEHQIAGEAEIL